MHRDVPEYTIRPARKPMKNFSPWVVSACLVLAASLTLGAPANQPLIEAAKKSDAKAVRSLIAARADIHATELDGSTALHWAVQRDNSEIVGLLLAAGADAKKATRYNITPLYFAATNGNADIIERLLK